MKNNKAQVEPLPLIMGIVGGAAGYLMSSRMDNGVAMNIIATVLTAGVSYFIAYFISNK